MIVVLLAVVVALVVAQQTSNVVASNGQTYIFRIETLVTGGGTFNFGAQSANGFPVNSTEVNAVGAVTISFVANGVTLTPTGSFQSTVVVPSNPSADNYQVVSFHSAQQLGTIQLCLNNPVLYPNPNTVCASLSPIGFGSTDYITRTTVQITQNFEANTTPTPQQTCVQNTGFPTGTCTVFGTAATPALLSNGAPTVSSFQEQISSVRLCTSYPEFIRGTITCSNVVLARSLAATGETAYLNSPILTSSLSSTTPTTLTLPRTGGYSFTNAGGSILSGTPNAAVGVADRGVEGFISGSTITQNVFDSYYVMFINVAHREVVTFDANSNPLSASSSDVFSNDATIVVEDGSSNVLHYNQFLSLTQTAPAFVELFLTANPTLTVSAVLRSAGFNNPAYNGSLSATNTGQATVSTKVFAPSANRYYVVALTTASDPTTGYLIQEFDVTPTENLFNGTQEEQIINLIQASQSSAQIQATVSSSVVYTPQQEPLSSQYNGVEFFQVATTTTTSSSCSVSSIPTVTPQNFVVVNGTFSGLTMALAPTASCPNPVAVNGGPQFTSDFSGAACGRRVTILIGRPYNVITPISCSVSTFASPTCTQSGGQTTVTQIGDLNFVGNSFFPGLSQIGATQFTSLPGNMPTPITFDISSCGCATPQPTTCTPTCGESQILAAISGSSGSVSGTVSGLAGSISAVANSVNGVASSVNGVASNVNNVITRLTRLNSTLLAVKNLDNDIKDLVKKRC